MPSQKFGKIGTVDLALSMAVPQQERYQRRYLPIDPDSAQANRVEEGLTSIKQFARWKIDDWSAGEGLTKFGKVPAAYNKSNGIRPLRRTEGIELGPFFELAQDNTGVADITGILVLGRALGTVYAVDATNVYAWDSTFSKFGAGTAHGGGTPVSICDGGDGQYLFIGFTNGHIRRVEPGVGNSAWYTTTPFTNEPILQAFSGEVYALDGDDLYRIDLTTVDTRTLVGDVTGSGVGYLADVTSRNRIATSERGPIWIQRLDSGETLIWEYNVFADAQTRLGRLPLDAAWPYDISYHAGFIWVSFIDATDHNDVGEAFLFFMRGQQKGVLGPFDERGFGLGGDVIYVVGQAGEQIIVYYNNNLWGYTPSTGGINQLVTLSAGSDPAGAISLGYTMFVQAVTNNKVYRLTYTDFTSVGTIDSGRWDFRYPGLDKILVDVTVEMDPLPSGTDIEAFVSADRGAFTSIGTFNTVSGTTARFQVSNSTTAIIGREFEIRLEMNSSSKFLSPTVRAITARATGAVHEIEWVIAVDTETSKVGGSQSSKDVIDALNGLAASAVVSFTDPWQNPGHEAGDVFDVTIEDILVPSLENTDPAVAFIKLKALNPVVGS